MRTWLSTTSRPYASTFHTAGHVLSTTPICLSRILILVTATSIGYKHALQEPPHPFSWTPHTCLSLLVSDFLRPAHVATPMRIHRALTHVCLRPAHVATPMGIHRALTHVWSQSVGVCVPRTILDLWRQMSYSPPESQEDNSERHFKMFFRSFWLGGEPVLFSRG